MKPREVGCTSPDDRPSVVVITNCCGSHELANDNLLLLPVVRGVHRQILGMVKSIFTRVSASSAPVYVCTCGQSTHMSCGKYYAAKYQPGTI